MPASEPLIENIRLRLLPQPQGGEQKGPLLPDWVPDVPHDRPPVAAAVLIALVQRGGDLSILYTERSSDLRSHSGQIAFPGGKIDSSDDGAGDAALREAWEEVALDRSEATILGYMPDYFTGTNYMITPVVALVTPTRPFFPNPGEVKSVFEVPLALLMADQNYGTLRIKRGGAEHHTWQITHNGLVIWGITANLTRRFYDLALRSEVQW